ncbi:hypothetical protein GOEFS_035_00570 [Gordonia effusa NBRC 100432]|uniref:Lipoprotein n=1 Tax=Gordonia effusa NBRC 100432 TaxID=1077974 RepID=H0QXH4_9ACTN|nr:hypothetical protein [Gordonia effusa]GAB17525.1 hypothetical protein GOEFS_035_00570 [Gordonia effusa NBRC 100432]
MSQPYRLPTALGGLLIGAALVSGCGGGVDVERPVPADMLLSPAALPAGFTSESLTVNDLTAANSQQLTLSAGTEISPQQCRPTADEQFNKALTPVNAAVLGARSLTAGLTEVVSTVTRDVGADIRTSTRDCARTTTSVTAGSMKGAVITTDHVRLDAPAMESSTAGYVGRVGSLRIIDLFVLRSTVSTRIGDGSVSTSVSLAGYATGRFTFDAPDAVPVTVQLTSVGEASDFAKPAGTPRSPMSDDEFVGLFGRAISAAGVTAG